MFLCSNADTFIGQNFLYWPLKFKAGLGFYCPTHNDQTNGCNTTNLEYNSAQLGEAGRLNNIRLDIKYKSL